jgi:hypothetical protein
MLSSKPGSILISAEGLLFSLQLIIISGELDRCPGGPVQAVPSDKIRLFQAD